MLTEKYFTVISILLQYNSHIKNEEDILSYSPTVVGHLLYLQTCVLLRKNPKPTYQNLHGQLTSVIMQNFQNSYFHGKNVCFY